MSIKTSLYRSPHRSLTATNIEMTSTSGHVGTADIAAGAGTA